MTTLSETATLRDARSSYFAANGFGDGGYDEAWVWLKVGPIPFAFPNSAGRVRAVRFHDLHHVLTAYATTWTGEAEIGAWELGSGCAHHVAAWVLNLGAVGVGLLIAPRAVWRAFVRGRHSGNLYREAWDEALLDRPVGAELARLGLAPSSAPTATGGDRALFALMAVAGLGTLLSATWPAWAIAGLALWLRG